jgi:3'-phosphoadenosine 5'-phosphosulfate sulfotransferase (PAPS reductase)/FAD synthetase
MKSPFLIEGPAVVSLSGGRTSAYMLRRILDEGLQPDVHVLFCNTGKEYRETLTFVDQIARYWGVPLGARLPGRSAGAAPVGVHVTTNGAQRNGKLTPSRRSPSW